MFGAGEELPGSGAGTVETYLRAGQPGVVHLKYARGYSEPAILFWPYFLHRNPSPRLTLTVPISNNTVPSPRAAAVLARSASLSSAASFSAAALDSTAPAAGSDAVWGTTVGNDVTRGTLVVVVVSVAVGSLASVAGGVVARDGPALGANDRRNAAAALRWAEERRSAGVCIPTAGGNNAEMRGRQTRARFQPGINPWNNGEATAPRGDMLVSWQRICGQRKNIKLLQRTGDKEASFIQVHMPREPSLQSKPFLPNESIAVVGRVRDDRTPCSPR
jgi:hypothetical protein